MLIEILMITALVVVTVAIHAVGLDTLLRAIVRSHTLAKSGFWTVIPLVIALTCWLLLIHLTEIALWGLFYLWQGCLPDAQSALYFSAGAYTTIGAGELALPKAWRMLAPIEALTAVLMCGLSTGLFFAIASRWINNWMQRQAAVESHSAAP
jgi:ion channel